MKERKKRAPGAYQQGQEMLNIFGNNLNIIKSKPTEPFCTFSTSAAKRVTVKSRSRAEEELCVGVQTTSASGRGDCPRGQPGTCPRFENVTRSRQGHSAHRADRGSTPPALRGLQWGLPGMTRERKIESNDEVQRAAL